VERTAGPKSGQFSDPVLNFFNFVAVFIGFIAFGCRKLVFQPLQVCFLLLFVHVGFANVLTCVDCQLVLEDRVVLNDIP